MTVAIGDIVRVSCRMLWDLEDDITNVFHFVVQLQDEPNDSDFMDEVADLLDAIYVTLEGHMTPIITPNVIEAKNITQDILLPTKAWPTFAGGTTIGGAMAPQTCPFSYYPTIKPRTQGRTYWPPLGEHAAANGRMLSGVNDDYRDAALDIQTGLGTVTVLLAYIVYNTTLGTWVIATTATTPVAVRTQRRRRVGVGS